MSQINIKFNGTDYEVSKSALSAAGSKIKQHLTSVINGEGASVDFGGTAYNVDSTKLDSARTKFVSHLNTIAGEGSTVAVNGVKYGVDASKVSNAISNMVSAFTSMKPIKLITFSTKDGSYQAEEGMTWEQWVNSEYNVDGWYVTKHAVRLSEDFFIVATKPSDIIRAKTYEVGWDQPVDTDW